MKTMMIILIEYEHGEQMVMTMMILVVMPLARLVMVMTGHKS